MTALDEVDGLTAADVMHEQPSTLPATATVGELRAYFAASSSRRLAVLADGTRFAGAIAVGTIGDAVEDAAPAAALAAHEPVVAPSAAASEARDLALAHPSRRLPVVEADGTVVGVIAIDKRLERFCS